MTLLEILTMLFAGLFTSNCVVGTASGIDLATNGFNTIKNATVYFVVILSVCLMSALTTWALSLILTQMNLSKFVLVCALVIVALYVQIAEYIMAKIYPLFLKQSYGFITILAMTAFVLLISTLGTEMVIYKALLKLLFDCLGIYVIFLIIAGLRYNQRYNNMPTFVQGNTSSLIMLFVLFLAFSIFY